MREKRGELAVHRLVMLALGEEYDERITYHKFRHYFVTEVYRLHGDIKEAQKLARHSTIETTNRYAHLGDILVRKGERVSRGTVIARVGNSGLSFAPHLHYEVRRGGKIMDPVNYFFAELKPGSYREMVITALNSGQSMD